MTMARSSSSANAANASYLKFLRHELRSRFGNFKWKGGTRNNAFASAHDFPNS
jgi:hypothetical protein